MVTLLSDIIDSKQPADLLAFLLVAPVRSFSIKELAHRLHTTTAKVTAGIRLLERNYFVKSFSKNQIKFVSLNVNHPQVKELREQCLTEQGHWPDELAVSLKKLGQLSGIFLSGLFVSRPELPVDLLLVGKVSPSRLDIFLKQTARLIGSELNYSIMTREEFVIRRDTFDRFIKDIFDYPHLVVIDRSNEKNVDRAPRVAKKARKKIVKKVSKKSVKKPAKKSPRAKGHKIVKRKR